MFVVRDTFHLKYGMFREAFTSIQQAIQQGLLPEQDVTILSDFTGEAYRLVIEISHPSLASFEETMSQGMKDPKWQEFYTKFKTFVITSNREIMRRHKL